MSGRRTSGTSRPSLEFRFLPSFPSFSMAKSQLKNCQGKRLEVPDILLPDIRGLLIESDWHSLMIANQSAMDRGQFNTNDSKLPCGAAKGLLARGTESLPKVTCAGAKKVCARATPCCASATSLCSYFRKDLLRPLRSTLGQISWFDFCPWQPGLQSDDS